MNMRLSLAVLAFACCTSLTSLSQPSRQWMAQYHIDILESMGLDYQKPQGFIEVPGWECFDSSPIIEKILTCVGNQLHADDGEFIAFIPIRRLFDEQDSIDINRLFPGSIKGLDRVHEPVARLGVVYAKGEEAAKDWKSHVNYYTDKEARAKFNADTAISYYVGLDSQDYYQGKYTHMSALILQKRGRGYINLYCFYTDKAKKRPRKYWKAIEGVFRYRDE